MGKSKNFLRNQIGICILIVFSALVFGMLLSSKAQAKGTGYKELFDETTYEKVVTSGSYSFKYEENKVYIKASGSEEWSETPIAAYEGLFANGESAYFMKENILSIYHFSDGSTEELKSLPKKESDSYYSISAMNEKWIFINRSTFDGWESRTYAYQISTKTCKSVFAGTLTILSGKYIVAEMGYKTDVSPSVFNLYKITGTGVKKVKKLSKAALSVRLVKNKLYFLEYTDKKKSEGSYYYGMSKGNLYRCNLSGSGKKKLGKIKGNSSDDTVYIIKITSKKCTLQIGNKKYVYTYKTKKLKRK